jgi:carboxypeptidase Taq
MADQKKLDLYKSLMHRIADINYSSAVLQWDQEVYMPAKGSTARSSQLATLAGIAHTESTSEELGDVINDLLNDESVDGKDRRNLIESKRNYKDRLKFTKDFVVKMSREVSDAFNAWQRAKKANDFSLYAGNLEKLVALKLEECEMLGYTDHPYDALINQHEFGATKESLDRLFGDVKDQLVPFVNRVLDEEPPDSSFIYHHYPKNDQWKFGIRLLEHMGFDFKAGRQDISTHPFTINFSANDVRVTTRINEDDLSEMIWSCIHEGGHALYEQGLPADDYGLPSGEYLSLGVHESQSRLWENNVGRSYDYWEHNYSTLQNIYPKNLSTVSLNKFYRGINKVQSSLIRTSADELTYHLHVLIRYELEIALIEKQIAVKDLPGEWNKLYKKYLNIDVPSDSKGVLQDVHWSHGSFGYFPTYSIGSFLAAQFFNKAMEQIPGLKADIRSGKSATLKKWLNENIHALGRQYNAEELCVKVTGEPLNLRHFMDYTRQKYCGLYPGLEG